MKFQIRDRRFGLAIQEADTPQEALAAFLADKAKGHAHVHTKVNEHGVGVVQFGKDVYYACPSGTEHTVPGG